MTWFVTRVTGLIATSKAGTTYPCKAPEFTPLFVVGFVLRNFSFLCSVL